MMHDSPDVPSAGNLDLIGALRVLRQRALLIVLCSVLTAGVAFAASTAQHKQYAATAQILFRDAQLDQQAAGLQVASQTNPQAQTDTNLKLATLPRVAAETASALDHGLTQTQVSNAVSVTQETGTDRPRYQRRGRLHRLPLEWRIRTRETSLLTGSERMRTITRPR